MDFITHCKMRSNKDFSVDLEDTTPSKGDLRVLTGHDTDSNEPSSISSLPINEGISDEADEGPEMLIGVSGEETAFHQKSPCKKQTARKSIWRENTNNLGSSAKQTEIKLEPHFDDDAVNISAKVLHFFCQKCRNGIRYSPNDLQKHFQIAHNGELPLYPCEMCNFSANDFQTFKLHRKTHRSTLVKCEICNDDYLYTLLALTKHFTAMHCVYGNFNCSKCRFSTTDVGTFVQHIHRHNGIEYACQKCNHISFSKIEFQRHLQGHSALFPFSCRYCNYSAMRKDFIIKHVLARHREQVHTKDELEQLACERPVEETAEMKFVLKRQSDSSSKLWRKETHNAETEKTREAVQSSGVMSYKSVDKSQEVKDLAAYHMNASQAMQDGFSSVTAAKCSTEESSPSGNLSILRNAVHGPTVLMVKNNKINVPANYSATFMGYKMVNGKQNIVIKLLPSSKQTSSTLQSPSQSSNNLTRLAQSPSQQSFAVPSNNVDSRPVQSFKSYTSQCPTSVASMQKQNISVRAKGPFAEPIALITRKNESLMPVKQGLAASQAFMESIRKDLNCYGIPKSSFTTSFASNIKEEPGEYSISDQQIASRLPNSLKVNSNIEHFLRHRHSSDSALTSSKTFLSKDNDISSMLQTSTASKFGNLTLANTGVKAKNDFPVSSVNLRDKQSVSLEKSNSDNFTFMPRITSVFSLQNRQSDSSSKSTSLNSSLQENKTLHEKICLTKTPSPIIRNSTSASTSQTNLPSRFDTFKANSGIDIKDNITYSASSFKQEPESGSDIKTSHSLRVGELIKAHSDAIVNQQLAKEKTLGVTRTLGASSVLKILQSPQTSSIPQCKTILFPSNSGTLLLPLLPSNQPGLKMVSNPSAPSPVGMNTCNRSNAPTVNTKPSMVLTFTNGPFGTIRNVTNGGSQVMGSQTIGSQGISTVLNQGKLPLPRLNRSSVPYSLNSDKDIGSAANNLPANAISGSSVTQNIPLNLNLLQYCINSDSSVVTTGNLESANKNQETVQKQQVYALLPDGKQAVLLNYVIPKIPATDAQKNVQGNILRRKLQPKNTDAQETTCLMSNRSNSAVSIKVENTSTEYDASEKNGVDVPCDQGSPAERKPFLRSRSNFATANHDKRLLSPSSANSSLQSNTRCKQNIANTWNAKSKALKRKELVDSSNDGADCETKIKLAKKKSNEYFQEPPRKKMLHRKCKEKTQTSDVLTDFSLQRQYKDIERTLKLYPFNSNQLIKFPRRHQPVVVLNHPDADVPEVINVMRTISKFSGHILKVSLSKRTLDALLESKFNSDSLTGKRSRRSKPVSPVKERFVLKLTLKKTSKNNYKIVKNTSENQHQTKFHCWFCGRIFNNQDEWVGHGQRHLMEATKDWNTF
ncbi:zinc finger protein 518A [Rhinophrynus dorsalis]